ncbi:MAG: hypothetical protein KDI66_09030 [Xanthomonadales bacterium]|nr:hypothetical protein [Xanthomonadales bacterium]
MMTNRTQVDLDDLIAAHEWVSCDGPFETAAYISRADGKIYWEGEGIEEELPADIEDGTLYIMVPHRREFDLGARLALRFAADQLSGADYDQVRAIFGRRGAFARFEDLLDRRGRLQLWYDHQNQALIEALREWCEESGLELSQKRREP